MPRKIGSVVRLKLKSGRFAYIQWIGKTWSNHDIIRVLPGRYDEPRDSELEELVAGPTDFITKCWLAKVVTPDDESLGVVPVPAIPDSDLWFRAFVSESPESPEWWLVDRDANTMTRSQYEGRYPEVDQLTLPLDDIPFPGRVRWLIDVGWHPRYITSRLDNWYPDEETGAAIKGTPGRT
jgi:hypothetical protein